MAKVAVPVRVWTIVPNVNNLLLSVRDRELAIILFFINFNDLRKLLQVVTMRSIIIK